MSDDQQIETLYVEFYRAWRSFPHTRTEDDEIHVSVYPNGQHEGGNYGFSIRDVGTEPNRHRIALRVQMFADSWRAFTDLPAFFEALSSLDESTTYGRESSATLDDLTPHLLVLGWTDNTSTYESQHEHLWGCLTCRERLPYPPGVPGTDERPGGAA